MWKKGEKKAEKIGKKTHTSEEFWQGHFTLQKRGFNDIIMSSSLNIIG